MKKASVFLSLFASVLVVGTALPVLAQTTPDVSGSKKSTDFQPSTDNPQGNVGTGLQTTNSGLQPTPGQTNFSQPVLSGSADLQVAGTQSSPNRNTTTATSNAVKYPLNPLPFIVIGLLTLAGVLYTVLQPGNGRGKKLDSTPQIELEDIKPEVVTLKPKKTKTTKKKSTGKKRKK